MRRADDIDWSRFRRILGKGLRTRRRDLGWTRADLIVRLNLHLADQTLASYEQGTRNMTLPRFIDICSALELRPWQVIKQTCEQSSGDSDEKTRTIDLTTAALLDSAELGPLRRWATIRLQALPSGATTTMRLTHSALQALAPLCGLELRELQARLPSPSTTKTDQ